MKNWANKLLLMVSLTTKCCHNSVKLLLTNTVSKIWNFKYKRKQLKILKT